LLAIVDTNVPVVANGRKTNATLVCQKACIRALKAFLEGNRILVLDSGEEVLREYGLNLRISGKPGVGDMFLRWAHNNQANNNRCIKLELTPLNDSRGYEEFPADPELSQFDRNDRKFVALAIACRVNPPILHATDRGWWIFEGALQNNGIVVEHICPEEKPSRL